MSHATEQPIVIFDGHCNFCSRSVRFILARDRAGYFRFAPAQSDTGRRLLLEHGLNPEGPGSIVLIDQGQARLRSDASLTIASHLDGPWRHLGQLRALPEGLRDAVYGLISRIRYRLAGRRESCMVPTPDQRTRFLD